MVPKNGNSRRIPFITNSVDDWLDEKKKLEGAEGLWRIHDKLYDFTVWSRTHPGGKFWIDVTRGTDITEVFETHHLTNKAESLLLKFYKREAVTPRNFFTTFSENGFYKVFKRKVSQQRLATLDKHSLTVQLLNDGLAASAFLTGFFGIKNGILWTIASGVLLGLLSAFSHSFFHSRKNWRINYFDLSLMSSRDWKIRHVLSHHQYRNTIWDLEIPIWKSFSENHAILGKYLPCVANLFMFCLASHVQFLQRCLDVLLSKKLGFNPEELVGFSFPFLWYLFGEVSVWEVFVRWNLTIMIASFCFCTFSSNFFMCSNQITLEKNGRRETQDFGITQLSLLGNPTNESNSGFSFINSFRRNVLHYLCPRITCDNLNKFIPVLENTIQEIGIFGVKKSTGFLEEFESEIPRGHIFFS